MKMPDKIEPAMFAPCGMNCLVCYKHCYHKKPCAGCLKSDPGKPNHCRKCGIKDCVKARQITYCFECSEYPCKQTKRLEKSYNTRYNASLVENSCMVKEQGLAVFLKQKKERYTCPSCGGVISIHDADLPVAYVRKIQTVQAVIPENARIKTGVVYHREGVNGDYDEFEDAEKLVEFIKTGNRS